MDEFGRMGVDEEKEGCLCGRLCYARVNNENHIIRNPKLRLCISHPMSAVCSACVACMKCSSVNEGVGTC